MINKLFLFVLCSFLFFGTVSAKLNDVQKQKSPTGNLQQLLNDGAVELKIEGEGIQSIQVKLRKLVKHSLSFEIPIGAYFVSGNASSQNMVSTASRLIRLNSNQWQTFSLPAACANRPKDIPSDSDTFTYQTLSNQGELVKLMARIKKVQPLYVVKQAAVWIVTDDADFQDMGILSVNGYYRAISETSAAEAMKICADAGIDLPSKRIWGDRKTIAMALKKGALKTWLQAQ